MFLGISTIIIYQKNKQKIFCAVCRLRGYIKYLNTTKISELFIKFAVNAFLSFFQLNKIIDNDIITVNGIFIERDLNFYLKGNDNCHEVYCKKGKYSC